jgi:short-subunit dehydrogenase
MVILITGVTGGLGGVLGKKLLEQGHTVYGAARRVEGKEADYPFPLVPMDVKDEQSVETCFNSVKEKEGRIDVLINCINEMFIGGLEEFTIDEVKGAYDTNVFGCMRQAKKIVPIMREQGGGLFMTLSSAGGLLGVPFMSTYTSSKVATEYFCEALRHEVRDDNIEVVIMQPVAMRMDRGDTGDHLRLVDNVKEGSFSHRMVKMMSRDTAKSNLTPEIVSDKIVEVLAMDKKPVRVPMDRAKKITMLKRLAPQSMVEKAVMDIIKSAPK